MAPVARDGWAQTVGLKSLPDCNVLDALWRTLTVEAVDPDRRALPLMPTHGGMLELHLANHSCVRSRKFAGEADEAWPAIQAQIHRNYRSIKDGAAKGKDKQIHRRWLTLQSEKYRLDTDLFIPPGLAKEKPLPHHTEYSDTFDGDGGYDAENWVPVSSLLAPWKRVSGQMHCVNESDGFPAILTNLNALSGDDHYSQNDFVYAEGTNAFMAPAVRIHASAATCYFGLFRAGSSVSAIYKVVSDVATSLVSGTDGTGPTVTLRLSVDGSTLSLEAGGSEVEGVTDTAITGNLYCGLAAHGGSNSLDSGGDNWSCADLAAGTETDTDTETDTGTAAASIVPWHLLHGRAV